MTPAQTLATIWDAAFERLPQWRTMRSLLEHNLAAHGDGREWLATIAALPRVDNADVDIGSTIRIGAASDFAEAERLTLRENLHALQPWRKGPFEFFGVHIDSEWRSDWKWDRVAPHLSPLVGRTVLDVGCGNGYYGWRMCAAGAGCVIGIDPTLNYLMQYLAASRYLMPARPAFVKRCCQRASRTHRPAARSIRCSRWACSTTAADPLEHLHSLRAHLRPDGQLVLETLIVDGATSVLTPADRYARMRNVWQIPDRATLLLGRRVPGFATLASSTSPRRRRPNSVRRSGCRSSRSRNRSIRPTTHDRRSSGAGARGRHRARTETSIAEQ